MSESDAPRTFHPYRPAGTRRGLLVGLLLTVPLIAWSGWDVMQGRGASAWLRLAGAALLCGAFFFSWWKLRPREGYGALITPLGVTFARPMGGEPVTLGWSEVRSFNREGPDRDTLVVHLVEGEWRLQSRMFASGADFEAMVTAMEERLPRRLFDA